MSNGFALLVLTRSAIFPQCNNLIEFLVIEMIMSVCKAHIFLFVIKKSNKSMIQHMACVERVVEECNMLAGLIEKLCCSHIQFFAFRAFGPRYW